MPYACMLVPKSEGFPAAQCVAYDEDKHSIAQKAAEFVTQMLRSDLSADEELVEFQVEDISLRTAKQLVVLLENKSILGVCESLIDSIINPIINSLLDYCTLDGEGKNVLAKCPTQITLANLFEHCVRMAVHLTIALIVRKLFRLTDYSPGSVNVVQVSG